MTIRYLKINKLLPHEKTHKRNLAKVKRKIIARGYLKYPVVVEKKHKIILDGHHRTKALFELGYKKIPALLVNYSDSKIKVVSRRKNIKINKQIIVEKVLQNKVFPNKTSKHFIPNRSKNINIPLWRLK